MKPFRHTNVYILRFKYNKLIIHLPLYEIVFPPDNAYTLVESETQLRS